MFVLGIIYSQQILTNNPKQHSLKSLSFNDGQATEKKTFDPSITEDAIYHLIGKDAKIVTTVLGQPQRIDASEYDYDWWIYNNPLTGYCQIGIEDNKVVTVFVMGSEVDIGPFKIGQSREELNNIVNLNEKVSFEVEQNFYRFELTKEEFETAPVVQVGEIWAQVFFDNFSNTLSSIRFIDGKTLVKIRPYELVYRGELFSANENLDKWKEIEKGKSFQILDMTNIIRVRNGLNAVNWDEETAMVAYNHSKEMFQNDYFSHLSPLEGGLSDRLINGGVMFKVAGENIAARYVDAISAVEGWQNSEGHRTTLLNKEFTHLGVGVFEKYYTQNFIQAW